MLNVARGIADAQVAPGSVAIFWLAQAGFAFKGACGTIIFVDPYLSNAAEARSGLKRIMASPMAPEDVDADLLISTHAHVDHLDSEAIPIIARNPRVRFAGPAQCVEFYREIGLSPDRYQELSPGVELEVGGVRVLAVFADHGEQSPDAVGLLLDFDGVRIYHTGDTAFRPEEMRAVADLRPDVLLPCINGTSGNMGPEDAACLVQMVHPSLVIPTHFWMFVKHNGNPGRFEAACREIAPDVNLLVMTQGEGITVGSFDEADARRKTEGQRSYTCSLG